MTVTAAIGATALYLLFVWLASAIAASYLSERKGYGEKPGLASGLLLSAVGVVVWLAWPPRPDSAWKREGPLAPRKRVGREPAEPAPVGREPAEPVTREPAKGKPAKREPAKPAEREPPEPDS